MLRVVAALALFAAAAPASAEEPPSFDVAAWALALDPDRPAGGEYVVYGDDSPAPETLALLRRSLFASDPRLSEPAVETLELHGVPHGEGVLLELARSERWDAVDEALRASVIASLRRMQSGRALPVHARVALQDSGRPAREAIRALCESEAPEALPVLRALAGGGDAKKRNLVVRFLRRTGERDAAREARRLRRDARQDQRREVREDKRERRRERREQRQGR